MTISNFRELRVWQTAMELVVAVYDLTRSFPPEERYGLVNQMRRAAVSIPSNIAEGNARESSKEYFKHLSIAQGSLAELQTQLEIALRLGFTEGAVAQQCIDTSVSVARQLFALRNAIARKVEESR